MSQVRADRTTTMTATTTSTSTPLKGKSKDDSRWWNSYALLEQQRRLVPFCFATLNSSFPGQSCGQVPLSFLPTKASLQSSDAHSRHQGSSFFNLRSSFLLRHHALNPPQLSVCRLTKVGSLHTSQADKDPDSGASGEPLWQTVGTSLNP